MPQPPNIVRRRVVAHGRVQGVWFRDSCRQVAIERGVAGWALNRPDGTVEVLLEGAHDAVGEVVEWCHTGPPRAQVTRVELSDEELDPTDRLHGFHIA